MPQAPKAHIFKTFSKVLCIMSLWQMYWGTHVWEFVPNFAKNCKLLASSPDKKNKKSVPTSGDILEEIDDILLPGSAMQTPKSPPTATLSQKASIWLLSYFQPFLQWWIDWTLPLDVCAETIIFDMSISLSLATVSCIMNVLPPPESPRIRIFMRD